jgi:hypothetical protein
MAEPTCIKCDGKTFQLTSVKPKGASIAFNMIHCSSCGGVVGVVDQTDIGSIVDDLHDKLVRNRPSR